MTGKLTRTDGKWMLHHTCYRYLPEDDEDFSPSIYPIDKDSLQFLSELTMFSNPEGKMIEFKVVHRDAKGNLITDYDAVPIEEWTWEAHLIPPAPVMWRQELKKVKQCPQRQDSTVEQLKDLKIIAGKFGFSAEIIN